jgi:GTP-binding protein HflX
MTEPSEHRPDLMKRAMLIGIDHMGSPKGEAEVLLDELAELIHTLGGQIAHKEIVHLRKPTADFLMGFGKANTILELAKAHECDILVFDNELSPAQQRNWEKLSKMTVIDRQEVILDIFAKRAHTKEAILQVELARQEYFLPRLKRAWTHLSRQRGGGAMQRNEGETQLEADRRMIRTRIVRLKKELEEVVKHRDIQRKRRLKLHLPSAAIIGYTNAGKSSLLNRMTGAEVLAENKLFATLDPTTRRLTLAGGQKMLLTDTVGFIRNLPHRLVEAFKATLEEAVISDFLIHVVDASSNDLEHHMETTLSVMEELGAKDKPRIIVFNKIDLLDGSMTLPSLKARFPKACFISTKTQEGLDGFLAVLEEHLAESFTKVDLLIPHTRYDLINQLHEVGTVIKETFEDEGIYISAKVPKEMLLIIEEFKK